MSEFDAIATRYCATASMAIRQVMTDTILRVIGDLAGKAVLDLACGSGIFTRLLKERGASRVVGVDLSSEMVKLAREEEARARLGIEYLEGDAAKLGRIGDFDLVTASFLLHYAPDEATLVAMLQTVRANLRPGGHFVTANLDIRLSEQALKRDLTKYGFNLRPHASPLEAGTPVSVTLLIEQAAIEFVTYYLPKPPMIGRSRTLGCAVSAPTLSAHLVNSSVGRRNPFFVESRGTIPLSGDAVRCASVYAACA